MNPRARRAADALQFRSNKKLVQDAVVGSSSVAADQSTKPSEVVSLLLDDRELEESLQAAQSKRRRLEENRQTFGERSVSNKLALNRSRTLS